MATNELSGDVLRSAAMQTSQSILSLQRRVEQERDEAQRALAESESRFRALSEFSPLGVFKTDINGRFEYTNPRLLDIFERTDSEFRGSTWSEILRADEAAAGAIEAWQNAVRLGHELSQELRVRRVRQGMGYVQLRARPIFNSVHEVSGFVGTVEDVSARKLAEQQLKEMFSDLAEAHARLERQAVLLKEQNEALEVAQAKAELASRCKSEFIANMSHEIRTPMTSILGFVELLCGEEDDELDQLQRKVFLQTIQRNGEHLLAVINDILDISKIEAGKMSVEKVAIDPAAFVTDVVRLMQVTAEAKSLPLNVEFPAPLPTLIHSDPLRLRQILVNLIGNAIKFTELGSVTVRVQWEREPTPRLLFSIIDTGRGMTQEQVSRLFNAFEQADTSTTRKFGGTGLGLRISERLAEMLGGSISVASEFGKGSTFTLELVLDSEASQALVEQQSSSTIIAAAAVETASSQPLAGLRILFAEDGLDNQRLISFYLRKAGADVTIVDNGKRLIEGVTVGQALQGELVRPPRFDLLITDMLMPEIDGYRAVQILRAKGWQLPIIALTANAMPDDLRRCFFVGCSHFVSKPIQRHEFIKTCAEAARMLSAPRTSAD